jgi:hypothetical protein
MRFPAFIALTIFYHLVSAVPIPASNCPADCTGARIRNVIRPAPGRAPIPSAMRQQRHKIEPPADAPRPWRPEFPGDIPPDYDTACEWVKLTDADFETKWAEIRKWHEYFAHTFGDPEDRARIEAELTAGEEMRLASGSEAEGTESSEEGTPIVVNNNMGFHNPAWKRNLPEENGQPYRQTTKLPVSYGLWSPPTASSPKHWLHETSWRSNTAVPETGKQPK